VFKTRMRGYDPEEVGYYLKSVAEEVERLNLENGKLKEDLGRLGAEHEAVRSREEVLQKTLVTAQRMSDELKERSEAQADLVIREARMKSERMLQQAQDQLAKLEAEISRCKIERDLFEKRLRSMIDEHVTLLEQRGEEDPGMDNVRVLPRRTDSEVG
jgi:cell division initiation protein